MVRQKHKRRKFFDVMALNIVTFAFFGFIDSSLVLRKTVTKDVLDYVWTLCLSWAYIPEIFFVCHHKVMLNDFVTLCYIVSIFIIK